MGVEPTKEIAATSGWVSSASTASLSPCTTFSTPGGNPASVASSASQFDAEGSFSLGLSTTVFPAAIAIGKNQSGTMAGKLNGVISPTTPTGSRTEYTSTPVDAFWLNSPLVRCGMDRANSTTSRP